MTFQSEQVACREIEKIAPGNNIISRGYQKYGSPLLTGIKERIDQRLKTLREQGIACNPQLP